MRQATINWLEPFKPFFRISGNYKQIGSYNAGIVLHRELLFEIH